VLHAVTQGDQGFAERSNRVEFIQYDKITVKMSWLFFVKTLQDLSINRVIFFTNASLGEIDVS
jgi:hypothetical protein